MKVVNTADLDGKKVLVRADLDVPIDNDKVVDDFRLKAILPTLEYLISSKAQQIIMIGHLGRPKRREADKSLRPVVDCLSALLKTEIVFIDSIDHEVIENKGRVVMLENLKFWEGETQNDPKFTQDLASLGDVFVNESFAVSHHEYASIVTVPTLVQSYIGFRFVQEVEALKDFWQKSQRPICFLLGGAKKDKLKDIKTMIEKSDFSLIGGVFMYERSLESIKGTIFAVDAIDWGDIGPKTIEFFKKNLARAKTVLWNGPLGKFEQEKYAQGTKALAQFLGDKVSRGELTVKVGGGDTISALRKFKMLSKMSFVSTGGGAMLELLAKGDLPGMRVLDHTQY